MSLFKEMFRSVFYFTRDMFYSLVFYRTIKVYLANHLTVGIKYLHKQNVVLPHPVGIVVGMNVRIGKNCTIYQNVTIGTKDTENFKTAAYPILGDNVTIYANSVIFGDIKIGQGSIIGAGSVVFINVPEYSVVGGNPASVIKKLKS